MFDQRLFISKVDLAALISVTAMVAFTFYAMSQQTGIGSGSDLLLVAAPMVSIA